MIIINEQETYSWLSKDIKDFFDFEAYCLLIGVEVDYSPMEYSISSCLYALGEKYPEYYHLDLIEEEEQALIEFAKIKNEEIQICSVGHRDYDDEQGKYLYPYEPTDGSRMFGKEP